MSLKTIYSVDDTYDVHAEADKVFVDILTTMEEPYELTLEAVGDLINALEMAYTDAVDLKEAADAKAEKVVLGFDGSRSDEAPIVFTINSYNPVALTPNDVIAKSQQLAEALAYAGHNID